MVWGYSGSSYDSYLSRLADEYWTPCEPETDKDGEYTKCENCLEQCEAYKEIRG